MIYSLRELPGSMEFLDKTISKDSKTEKKQENSTANDDLSTQGQNSSKENILVEKVKKYMPHELRKLGEILANKIQPSKPLTRTQCQALASEVARRIDAHAAALKNDFRSCNISLSEYQTERENLSELLNAFTHFTEQAWISSVENSLFKETECFITNTLKCLKKNSLNSHKAIQEIYKKIEDLPFVSHNLSESAKNLENFRISIWTGDKETGFMRKKISLSTKAWETTFYTCGKELGKGKDGLVKLLVPESRNKKAKAIKIMIDASVAILEYGLLKKITKNTKQMGIQLPSKALLFSPFNQDSFVIMPLYDGSLLELHDTLSKEQNKLVAKHLREGALHHLQANNIAHTDIMLQNIFIRLTSDDSFRCDLGDFSSATFTPTLGELSNDMAWLYSVTYQFYHK